MDDTLRSWQQYALEHPFHGGDPEKYRHGVYLDENLMAIVLLAVDT